MENVKKNGRQWLLALVAVAVFLVFLAIHHTKDRHMNVPTQLIGTWTTTAPQYAGRVLEIGPQTLDFGIGKGKIATGFIENVESTADGADTLYTITYSLKGSQQRVAFHYSDRNGKSIRLEHQEKVVWVPAS